MGEAGLNGHSQVDDNSQTADGAGANVRVSLVGYDHPFFLALAVVLSFFACLIAWNNGSEGRDELKNYQMEKRLVLNHMMQLEARLDAIERYGTKEKTNAGR